MIMRERWREIDGHPGYQVSDLGRVRSSRQVLALQQQPSGYISVKLGAAAGRKYVHRLVAKAFVKGDHRLTVNHDDGDKSNNRWKNLVWSTKKFNTQHSYDVLGRKAVNTEQPILIDSFYFPNMVIAGALLQIPPASLRNALRLKRHCRGMKVTRVVPR